MSRASSPGKAQTGISAEADVFLEVGYPVTGSGGLEGGALDWRERRDSGGHQLLSVCPSLLPSGNAPPPGMWPSGLSLKKASAN